MVKSEPLITIILGSKRKNNLEKFIDNKIEKTKNLDVLEIIVCIDEGDNELIKLIKSYHKKLNIKYVEFNYEPGFFYIHHAYNTALGIASKSSYFFSTFSDKVMIQDQNWDENLLKYKNYFKDDLFALSITDEKANFYHNVDTTICLPDHFSFYTKRWIQLVGGLGSMWGTDSVMFPTSYLLSILNWPYTNRVLIAEGVSLEPYHHSQGKNMKQKYVHALVLEKVINYMCSFEYLKFMYLAALKMQLYIKYHDKIKDSFEFFYTEKELILSSVTRNGNRKAREIVHTSKLRLPQVLVFKKLFDIILYTSMSKIKRSLYFFAAPFFFIYYHLKKIRPPYIGESSNAWDFHIEYDLKMQDLILKTYRKVIKKYERKVAYKG